MQLVKYNPFEELRKMEKDMEKFWSDSWGTVPVAADSTVMDMYEKDGNLVAEIGLPNFNKDEIKVTADEDALEILAEHKEKKEDKDKKHYYFRESRNDYYRRVRLPEGVKAEKADADFKDGMLRITMPMATPKKASKKVAIK